jgi:transketolase
MNVQELELKANDIRKTLLQIIHDSGTGHTGGSLSSADILTALYYHTLHIDSTDPDAIGRDRFILSKGHCVEGYYTILADRGFIPKEELHTYCQYGTKLIGHPNNEIPGIEVKTGALGHGLPVGVGMAIGLKKNQSASRVFVLMGDGEQEEGSVWEAAMSGSHYKLDNLTGIVDRNHLQISGTTEDVIGLEPFADRWRAFGWAVREIDGNDMEQLIAAFDALPLEKGKPSLIIAHTVKGKGVREMENKREWHHGVPDETLLRSAFTQLDAHAADILKKGAAL